jgi:hypothetical protein
VLSLVSSFFIFPCSQPRGEQQFLFFSSLDKFISFSLISRADSLLQFFFLLHIMCSKRVRSREITAWQQRRRTWAASRLSTAMARAGRCDLEFLGSGKDEGGESSDGAAFEGLGTGRNGAG